MKSRVVICMLTAVVVIFSGIISNVHAGDVDNDLKQVFSKVFSTVTGSVDLADSADITRRNSISEPIAPEPNAPEPAAAESESLVEVYFPLQDGASKDFSLSINTKISWIFHVRYPCSWNIERE